MWGGKNAAYIDPETAMICQWGMGSGIGNDEGEETKDQRAKE
jgi:hypothetical protein